MSNPNPTPDQSRPYGDHARAYLDAGWRGPLPLPPHAKQPVPTGFTGRAGEWPGGPDIWTWMEDYATGNIALRLPENVIGIDIDAYPGKPGALTLANTEHHWGKLPPTWRTTSRDDGVSGIRLYTIPEGLDWPSEVGPGIEIVRYAHRYAIVWPSIHPETRNTYRWVNPDGHIAVATIPTIDDLAALPERYIQELTGGRADTRQARTPLTTSAARAALDLFNPGNPCRDVERALTRRTTDLQTGNGARHDTMLYGTERLVRLGIEGHTGIVPALTRLRETFLTAVTGERPPGEAEAEWDRSLQGALANVHTVDDVDPCVDPFHGLINQQPTPADIEPRATADPLPTPPPGDETTPAATDTLREQLVAQELERLRARRDAQRILADEEAAVHRTLEFRTISDIRNRPRPQWIVDGLIQGAGVVLIAGEPGIGKSFICLDIAARVATGTKFFGRDVRAGRVAYVYAEGGEYLPERWAAWEQHNTTQIPEDRLLIVEEGFNLSDPASVTAMSDQVKQRTLDLLIIDTLSQLSSVENENDAAQLAHVLNAARSIRAAHPGMTVLIVHHVNKGEKTRIRGSSAIKANADAVIVATQDKGGEGHFLLSTLPKHDGKQKNARAEAIRGFYLEPVGISAALERDTPDGAETVAIETVLADGEWHSPREFYDAIGDDTEAMQRKVLRRLNLLMDHERVIKQGNGRATQYRSTENDPDTESRHKTGGE